MKTFLFSLLSFFCIHQTLATHLRGGQITFKLIDCASNTYEITLTIYTNTQGGVKPGGGKLDFGDGSSLVVPSLSSVIIDNLFFVGEAIYKVNHQYAAQAGFNVNYTEPNRNGGVINIPNSAEVLFSIESFILVNGLCDQSIVFTIPPIDRACSGFIFTHNPGIVSPVDDSVSYELVTPLTGLNTPAVGYQNPNAKAFYPGNYTASNEAGTGSPTYQIGTDGTLVWDAPGEIGEYAATIKVYQWTKINGSWMNTTWVIRDMQIIVENCNASRPYLVMPPDLCVHPGDDLLQIIKGYDEDHSNVTIEVTTVDTFNSAAPQFVNDNLFQSTTPPNDTANIKVKWKITCDLVRPYPYKFIFKISSYPNGIRISSFQTWQVNVVGAAPAYQSVTLDLSKKALNIQWTSYPCPNAPVIEVWRRVDRDLISSDPCQIGIPRSWGFSKIGESSSGSFTDVHLNPGATYCYRLLAFYQTPYQTLSAASRDTCIGPIIVDAPVITNVSVNQTDKIKGMITVRWTSPFQINKSLFPAPYLYEVLRTKNGTNFNSITPSKISDTTFVDGRLDVTDSLFGYKIIVYSPNSIAHNNPIDTGALAFYPRLNYQSLTDGVKLIWDAAVPWSNQSPRFPWHYIFRKEPDDKFYSLLDSITTDTLTLVKGYQYVDMGLKPGFDIKPNSVYLYRIETQGVYGNPQIKEPLQNFSNEIATQPIDRTPPCTPVVSVTSPPCEILIQSPCTNNDFRNTLSWNYPDDCGNDVAFYKIFFSDRQKSDTSLLAITTDLSYIDKRQNSQAGCYRVVAVDRSGNVSEPSKMGCVENCINLFIPNVITANNDGLNETFPNLNNSNTDRDPIKCPRFVKKFDFQILNRWGSVVYTIHSSTTNQSELDWKGFDDKGQELPTGTYYFSGAVVFYTLDPNLENQNVKGWVSLMR